MIALKRSTIAWVLVLTLLAVVAVVAADLMCDGPYVTWFNRHHEDLAAASGIVGKDEDEIVRLFGEPSKIDRTPRAYVYYPYPLVPVSQVKVFVESGKVIGVKTFDD